MGNLIRMDLYRMTKAKAFQVSLILIALSALAYTPAGWGFFMLGNMFSSDVSLVFPKTAELADILRSPFPFLNAMIIMLAACSFFYADIEFGYIKNIAGQMPKKGYTVLSKFFAVLLQNALFMLVGVIFNLIGTLFIQKIVTESSVLNGCIAFLLKLLLMQACCTILLMFVAAFQNKSLGSVMAVLMGTGLLSLVYLGIDSGLYQMFKLSGFSIADYMPDQVLRQSDPNALRAILVSAVTIAIFLPLGIRVFDRRDIK